MLMRLRCDLRANGVEGCSDIHRAQSCLSATIYIRANMNGLVNMNAGSMKRGEIQPR